jgi:Pentapeptide repeats (8 copies)
MNKQSQEIIKLQSTSAPVKSTNLGSSTTKTVEVLKSFIRSINIPKEKLKPLTVAIVTASMILMLILININNSLSQETYQLKKITSNIELNSNYQSHGILSDYLKTMAKTIYENNGNNFKEKFAFMRAMTQATLQELDPGKKRYVIMFLRDANLLKISSNKTTALLSGANLAGVKLQDMDLKFTNLQGANLDKADLRGVDLRGANLENASLKNSCYSDQTLFSKNFDPAAFKMRKISNSKKCRI